MEDCTAQAARRRAVHTANSGLRRSTGRTEKADSPAVDSALVGVWLSLRAPPDSPHSMSILVINPNTTVAMTDGLRDVISHCCSWFWRS